MIIAPRTRLKISPFILYLSLDPVCCCENWRLGGCWYRTPVSCLGISWLVVGITQKYLVSVSVLAPVSYLTCIHYLE